MSKSRYFNLMQYCVNVNTQHSRNNNVDNVGKFGEGDKKKKKQKKSRSIERCNFFLTLRILLTINQNALFFMSLSVLRRLDNYMCG